MFEADVGNRHWRTWLVLEAVESVLGPNVGLILSHLIIKGTEDNMNVNRYQDQRYWLHGVEGDHLSTVWVSLDPAPAKKL